MPLKGIINNYPEERKVLTALVNFCVTVVVTCVLEELKI